MKITVTSKHTMSYTKSGVFTSRFFVSMAIVLCCLLSLVSNDIKAQTDNGPASIAMKNTNWKSKIELDQTLTAEIVKVEEMLTTPGLQPVDQSIYKAYSRMLTYIQQYIQNNLQVDEAINKGYQTVIDEAPKDPELSLLPDHMLGTYLPGLVEMLAAVNVPVAQPR